ncbi:MarR family winged helix-turn-helix transcriptional regulator [Streptomyces sp. NPDC059999]|uniref:MarR family winged helix-turn-helix transcriptional regulator n=1 Tax=Streptomyces sp. NPDC059999 TaxID=3347030 RepID=UPI0036C3A592
MPGQGDGLGAQPVQDRVEPSGQVVRGPYGPSLGGDAESGLPDQVHGMHPTDVRALICLLDTERAGEAATAGLLGARLGLNSAGTTAVIDRLERLGHVARVRDGADRRRVLLRVEPEAVRLGRAFFGPLIDRLLAVQGTLDPTEREAVRRFLTGARAALGEQEQGGPKRGEGQ